MNPTITNIFGVLIALLVAANLFHATNITGLAKLIRDIKNRQDDEHDALEVRVKKLERGDFWRKFNESLEALTPEQRAEMKKEDELWDVTLMDGMEDESIPQ